MPFLGNSQKVDYNKIIIPENIRAISFEEKLIQLAWSNNPTNDIAMQNIEMLAKEKKVARWSWLNDIYGVVNLNEFTINPGSIPDGRSNFFPRYNFGVRLSLGTFALTPLETKIANDKLIMGGYEINERKLLMRNQVLSELERLKEHYKIMRIRTRLKEDFLVLYREAEQKFSLGQIAMDQYRVSSQSYYGRVEAEINALSVFNQHKIALEGLLGLKLEDIEGYSGFLNQLDMELRID